MADPAGIARTQSSRQSEEGAGWRCGAVGNYTHLIPRGSVPLSWLSPVPLLQSRNDRLARRFGDPTNDERRRWVAAQLAAGVAPDFTVRRFEDRRNISFLLLGDPGEGDASQYCVIPGLLRKGSDTDFLFILSDVTYPAGDVHDFENKFYRAYADYPGPIYAVPGNHDWYDDLNGFMRHLCGADGQGRPRRTRGPGTRLQRCVRRLLWRNPSRVSEKKVAAMQALRSRPEQQARQPGPYFAIDAGPLLLVGIDTGIVGDIDRDQAEWLRRVSRESPKPKILLTGKPLYVDARPDPGHIEGSEETVDDIVKAPEHNYIAAIGGDVHNYQRYPVRLPDGRIIQYIVNGGGGAGSQGTHKIPRVDLPGVTEDDYRCYPRRGDSLAAFSRMYQRRLGLLWGKLEIPPDQAAALLGERLGIEPTRPADRDVVVTPQSRRAFEKVFPRRDRLPGPLHSYFVQFLDWNDPPMFKSFMRLDASEDRVELRCFAATGCREHELEPPLEDAVVGRRGPDGRWTWGPPEDLPGVVT